MADVGTEQGVQLGVKRVGLAVEGHDIHPVVRLAAEVEVGGKQVLDVLGCGDAAGRVVVQIFNAAGIDRTLGRHGGIKGGFPPAQRLDNSGAAVLLGEFTEQRMVEVGRINFGQSIDIALFPVFDQIDVELTRPADPAFEKGKLEVREASRHPTQEQRLTHRLVGGCEMTNMVIGEIAR